MVDEEFRRRREALATGYGVADPAAPEPVGCLLLWRRHEHPGHAFRRGAC